MILSMLLSGKARIPLQCESDSSRTPIFPRPDHLPAAVFDAFTGVDLVMHAGDVYVNRVLDELAQIAPVIAALGNGDEGLDGHRFRLDPDERVRVAHLLEIEG